jgi:hypothetical protein
VGTIKKAWVKFDAIDIDRVSKLLVGRVFNNARPKVQLV